ncbi:hypothetical protein AQ616_18880 [Oceanobacillus sp. E9]|uniref:hypothetical protein n=1 Tax=Oceanobacillus sp. E9 TaxID=1742575 RepID=UPI00084E80F9|nr:hypothetical protein [Oceanobacillus sp. E9]OEH52970.1 hypothetical protein AQ616_18880 [Oceanobacillus sp. E9]
MEKTLTIDDKQVTFKSTGSTVLRYKSQFGKDFFADLMKMFPAMKMIEKLGKESIENKDIDYETLQYIDFELFYNIIWVLAKTADKNIPEPMEWLDGFEEFPIMEILPELQELMMHSLQGKKKTQRHPAEKK